MKLITISLVAFLILAAAGCNNTGQPLIPTSTQEQAALQKDRSKKSITVHERSIVDAISIFVDGQRYDIANATTIEVPLSSNKGTLGIWECIWTVDHYECRVDNYPVERGGRYAVIDDGPQFNLTLVAE